MAEQVRIRRDNDAYASTHVGVEGEIGYNTDDGTLHTYDGVTPGGQKTVMQDAASVVTLPMHADLPANTVIGNATGSTGPATAVPISSLGGGGAPTVNANSLYGNNTGSAAPGASLSVAQAKTLLSFASSSELTSGLAAKADAAATTAALANKADKTINIAAGAGLTGGGNLDASMSFTLASIPAKSVIANVTVAPAIPVDVTMADLAAELPLATTGAKGVVQLSGVSGEVLTGTGWAAGGGSGLVAADVPDDIVGSFDAGQHLEILKAYSIATPPTDALALVRPDNRAGLAIVNQYGGRRRLMRDQSEVLIRRWQAQYGVAGGYFYPYASNITFGAGSTESAYVPVQGTTRLAALPRTGTRTGTSAGSVMYAYNTQYHSGMPKADSATGGFAIKFVLPRIHPAAVSSERAFVGMVPSGSVALYNAAYETIANHIGFVRKAGSDTVYLSYRGASLGGEIDLTAVNANLTWAGTVATPRGLVFVLETLREAPNKVYYEVFDVDNEAASKVTGVLSVSADNLPADNLPLTWLIKTCNNTDAAAVSLFISLVDLENQI